MKRRSLAHVRVKVVDVEVDGSIAGHPVRGSREGSLVGAQDGRENVVGKIGKVNCAAVHLSRRSAHPRTGAAKEREKKKRTFTFSSPCKIKTKTWSKSIICQATQRGSKKLTEKLSWIRKWIGYTAYRQTRSSITNPMRVRRKKQRVEASIPQSEIPRARKSRLKLCYCFNSSPHTNRYARRWALFKSGQDSAARSHPLVKQWTLALFHAANAWGNKTRIQVFSIHTQIPKPRRPHCHGKKSKTNKLNASSRNIHSFQGEASLNTDCFNVSKSGEVAKKPKMTRKNLQSGSSMRENFQCLQSASVTRKNQFDQNLWSANLTRRRNLQITNSRQENQS